MREYTLRIAGTGVVVWSYHANIACRYASDLAVIVKWVVEVEEVEKEEREDREIYNVQLEDLTDTDDELCLICFVLLNDVIYCLCKAQ